MWGRKSGFKTSSCRVLGRLSVVRSTRLYEISFIRITFLSDVFSMSSLSHTAAHREWCVVGKRKKLYKLRSTASFLAVLDCGNITPTETQSLAKQSSFDSLEITMKSKIHKKTLFHFWVFLNLSAVVYESSWERDKSVVFVSSLATAMISPISNGSKIKNHREWKFRNKLNVLPELHISFFANKLLHASVCESIRFAISHSFYILSPFSLHSLELSTYIS